MADKKKDDEEDLGENDTDDEQDFNGEEDDEPADPPYLSGKIEINDGRLYWSGKWAMSKEGYAEGKSQKFKYGGPTQTDAPAGDALVVQNGKFNGYFIVKVAGEDGAADTKEKVKEKGVAFTFTLKSGTTYTVGATGENKFGDFKMKGEYDSKTRVMECTKEYEGGDDDDDVDDDILDDDALPPDADEAADLAADNELTVEELRAKYYGGGGGDDEAEDEGPSAKKRKVEADDECDEF
jgi:hypothetical protein